MYVRNVQGRARACAESNSRRPTSAGEVKSVRESSRITAFAMISLPTQGVIRG
jgi:hypothetical protein